MIAYGYPQMIDPTPGDYLEMQLAGLKADLKERYPDGWVEEESR